jgi:ASPIC and UnbV/FG-GAP-like repeat
MIAYNKSTLNKIWGVFFLLLPFSNGYAQLSFIDKSSKLPNSSFYSWLQKGVADMNNDGKDDIIRADFSGNFFILKQQTDGSFIEQALGNIQSSTPLSVVVADIDNNGFADILTGGEYNGVRIIKANTNGSVYNPTQLPKDSIFTQASTLVDINNDGWLDVFVCNDDSTNAIWRNTGNGTFIRDAMGFDFSSVPLNKHSGNYGIVFTDFDNDGDLDAYLSKCRAGVTDSTDQRRINQLFVNNNGNFTDQAKSFGMADSSQTWITEFQDIDNDGDMDAFIANHHAPSRLMENDGFGHFKDITISAGLLQNMPDGILQALMRDFDNDGYVDLICSGMMGAVYFKNNGNKTFSSQNLPLLEPTTDKKLRSFAIGDLNHDGFQDIYASYYWGESHTDKLWLNERNNNHFIAINLKGTQSNHSAVGSKIILKANGKTQIREIRAGESYGISNSLTQYFGLGTNPNIDEISIQWTSGLKTNIINPKSNQFLEVSEPDCGPILCIPISAKIINNN